MGCVYMRKILSIVVTLVAAMLFFTACSTNNSSSKYLKTVTCADTSNYKAAVEIDSYDGDKLAAGTYTVTSVLMDRDLKPEETPVVWDIYVSSNDYSKISELQANELVVTAGGVERDGGEFTVKAGQYVYIKYNEVFGTPAGAVELKLNE